MDKKTYLITGASSGIGKDATLALAQRGATVILVSRNQDALQAVLKELPTQGKHAIYPCDLSCVETIEPTFHSLLEHHPVIDGFIHCAGSPSDNCRVAQLTTTKLHKMMAVHFYAFIECIRLLMAHKERKQELRIIAISSLASSTNTKYFSAYAAAKAAIEAAVRSLSTELIKKNTTIHAIKAGFVDTPLIQGTNQWFNGDLDGYLKKTGAQPLGIIPIEAVTQTILFLLKNSTAKYMTGTNFPLPAGAQYP